MRILIVDDDSMNLAYCTEALEEIARAQGAVVEITSAADGREGLELFYAQPCAFDYILSDFDMPQMDGVRMLHLILNREPGQNVAMMTFDSREANRRFRALKRRVTVFDKPVEFAEIRKHLKRCGLELK